MCHSKRENHYPSHPNVDICRKNKHTFFSFWAPRDTCSQSGSLDCTFMSTEQSVNYNQKFVGATCPEMTDGQLLPQTLFHPHASSKPVSLGHQQQCIQSSSSSWLLQSILILVCYYLLGGRSAEMQGSMLCFASSKQLISNVNRNGCRLITTVAQRKFLQLHAEVITIHFIISARIILI